MTPSSPRPPVLPDTWEQVLNRIVETLQQTIATATERESRLAELPQTPTDVPWQDSYARIDQRLNDLELCVQRADAKTREADRELAESAEALQTWLTALKPVGRRLAAWGKHGV